MICGRITYWFEGYDGYKVANVDDFNLGYKKLKVENLNPHPNFSSKLTKCEIVVFKSLGVRIFSGFKGT